MHLDAPEDTTLEDILEEIIGEFTTQSPLMTRGLHRQPDGSYVIEGGTLLRELNRKLGFNFPLDGPKTLNGLILEHLQDIPEPNTSVRIGGHPLEIVPNPGSGHQKRAGLPAGTALARPKQVCCTAFTKGHRKGIIH